MIESTNPLDYGYTGSEAITISAKEFVLLKNAVEAGIAATMEAYLPEVTRYVNVKTTKVVKNPTSEDLVSKKVVLVTDREATFSQENVSVKYNANKITREMIQAQALIMEIHERNVEVGVAIHSSKLK